MDMNVSMLVLLGMSCCMCISMVDTAVAACSWAAWICCLGLVEQRVRWAQVETLWPASGGPCRLL